MSAVTVAKLNRLVTCAILTAERTEGGTRAQRAAYAKVSLLEEQIADAMPANSIEGAISRRGAVEAALVAEDWARARDLVRFYIEEVPAPPPDLAGWLKGQLAEASEKLGANGRMGRRAMLAAIDLFSAGPPKDARFVGVRCPECGRSDGGHNSRCPNRVEP